MNSRILPLNRKIFPVSSRILIFIVGRLTVNSRILTESSDSYQWDIDSDK